MRQALSAGLLALVLALTAGCGMFAAPPVQTAQQTTYILNLSTGKFHLPACPSVSQMKDSNKLAFTGSRENLLARGYSPCLRCGP